MQCAHTTHTHTHAHTAQHIHSRQQTAYKTHTGHRAFIVIINLIEQFIAQKSSCVVLGSAEQFAGVHISWPILYTIFKISFFFSPALFEPNSSISTQVAKAHTEFVCEQKLDSTLVATEVIILYNMLQSFEPHPIPPATPHPTPGHGVVKSGIITSYSLACVYLGGGINTRFHFFTQ